MIGKTVEQVAKKKTTRLLGMAQLNIKEIDQCYPCRRSIQFYIAHILYTLRPPRSVVSGRKYYAWGAQQLDWCAETKHPMCSHVEQSQKRHTTNFLSGQNTAMVSSCFVSEGGYIGRPLPAPLNDSFHQPAVLVAPLPHAA